MIARNKHILGGIPVSKVLASDIAHVGAITKASTVICDWSGVISDDLHPVYRANMRMLERRGMPTESYDYWHGALAGTVLGFCKRHGITGDEAALKHEYRDTYAAVCREGIRPVAYSDAEAFLSFVSLD
jgi:hypothetical protein